MFCPNCGKDCGNANFCPGCGQNLQCSESAYELKTYPPLNEPFVQIVSGKEIDLNKVVRTYGNGWRKSGAYAYLSAECGISIAQAKQILDPIFTIHEGEKISFLQSLSAEVNLRSEKVSREKDVREQKEGELKNSGEIHCPKCLSTSVTAQKRGYSIGQAILAGPLAGAIGSNKVHCICLKCGHKWKPGR